VRNVSEAESASIYLLLNIFISRFLVQEQVHSLAEEPVNTWILNFDFRWLF